MIVYLNGRFLPLEDAKISVLDRGFIYGDGVYELIPVYAPAAVSLAAASRAAAAQPRRDSTRQSAHRRRVDVDHRQRSSHGSPFEDQGVYLQVTRGVAKRDHAFPPGVPPTVFMMSNPLATPSAEQVDAGVAVVTAEDNRWRRCDLKTISLVGNVLMRQLAADAGAVETVMFRDGFLTEASASNVLVVIGGSDRRAAEGQPDPARASLTTRRYEFAREAGLPFEVRPVPKAEALAADEMWLTSSTKEVLAVTTVDGRRSAGAGPGRCSGRMYALFQEHKPRAR